MAEADTLASGNWDLIAAARSFSEKVHLSLKNGWDSNNVFGAYPNLLLGFVFEDWL